MDSSGVWRESGTKGWKKLVCAKNTTTIIANTIVGKMGPGKSKQTECTATDKQETIAYQLLDVSNQFFCIGQWQY